MASTRPAPGCPLSRALGSVLPPWDPPPVSNAPGGPGRCPRVPLTNRFWAGETVAPLSVACAARVPEGWVLIWTQLPLPECRPQPGSAPRLVLPGPRAPLQWLRSGVRVRCPAAGPRPPSLLRRLPAALAAAGLTCFQWVLVSPVGAGGSPQPLLLASMVPGTPSGVHAGPGCLE